MVKKISKKYPLDKRVIKLDDFKSKPYSPCARQVQTRLEVLHKNEGLLVVISEEELPNRQLKRTYGLSLKGLVVVIQLENSWEFLEKLVTLHTEKLPKIFKNWDYLVSKGLSEQLRTALKCAVNDSLVNLYVSGRAPDKAVANRVISRFIFSGMQINIDWTPNSIMPLYFKRFDSSAENWIKAIEANSELSTFFWSELETMSKKFQNGLTEIQTLKNEIARLDLLNFEESRTEV